MEEIGSAFISPVCGDIIFCATAPPPAARRKEARGMMPVRHELRTIAARRWASSTSVIEGPWDSRGGPGGVWEPVGRNKPPPTPLHGGCLVSGGGRRKLRRQNQSPGKLTLH